MNRSQPSSISPSVVAAATRKFAGEAWVAGGWVRDRLLSRKSPDADLVVAGNAQTAARSAACSLDGSFVVLDQRRHIYRVALAGVHIDFSPMRGATMEEDLSKRDFTINAIALPASRAAHRLWRRYIIDPTGGLSDIAEQVVRPASPSVFEEDPLRTLRAIRLAAILGFTVSAAAQKAIKRDAHLLARVAAERIRDELFPILRSGDAHTYLVMAQRLGLMTQIIPETQPLHGLRQGRYHRLDAWGHTLEAMRHLNRLLASPGSWAGAFARRVRSLMDESTSGDRSRADVLRFACLLHDIGKPATLSLDEKGMHFYGHAVLGAATAAAVARRLRLSRQETYAVRTIVQHHMRPLLLTRGPVTDRALRRFIADAGDRCVEIAVLALADLLAGRPSPAAARAQRAFTIRLLRNLFTRPVAPAPMVNGDEVMKHYRLQPGPVVGRLLDIVRRAQIERGLTTRNEAWAILDAALGANRD